MNLKQIQEELLIEVKKRDDFHERAIKENINRETFNNQMEIYNDKIWDLRMLKII